MAINVSERDNIGSEEAEGYEDIEKVAYWSFKHSRSVENEELREELQELFDLSMKHLESYYGVSGVSLTNYEDLDADEVEEILAEEKSNMTHETQTHWERSRKMLKKLEEHPDY